MLAPLFSSKVYLPHPPAVPLQVIISRVPVVLIQKVRTVFIADQLQMICIDLGDTFCHIGKGDTFALADEKGNGIQRHGDIVMSLGQYFL